MRLVLIRHGESHAFLQKTIADIKGCTGLTERGVAQVNALAQRLRTTQELADCSVFLSSPIPRALQTAALLLDALPVDSFLEYADLRDLIPGEADGLSEIGYAARYGRFNLMAEPERPFAPGGENWTTFTGRVRGTMQRLAEQYAGQTVVAACHSGFIMMSILQLFDIPRPGTGAYLNPIYTGLTEWEHNGARWSLVRYNDAAHLTEKS